MTIFWLLSVMAVGPFLWMVSRGLRERRTADVAVLSMIFCICMLHLFILYAKTYENTFPGLWLRIVHSVLICQFLPMAYYCVCKRLDIERRLETILLISLTVLTVFTGANICIGWGDHPQLPPAKFFDVNFYLCDRRLMMFHNYEAVLLMQGMFLFYKVVGLIRVMKLNNYHFSTLFRRMLYIWAFALVMIMTSVIPDDEFWMQGSYMLIFITVCFVLLGMNFVMLAFGYDIGPVVDVNEEPVAIGRTRQFSDMAERFRKLLDSGEVQLSGNVRMDDVAQMLGTNRTYVAQMMKEEFGMTFTAYLNGLRVEKAKRIIVESNYEAKMQDVAWQSGFSSLSSFNKVFKTVTGVAPSEYEAPLGPQKGEM